MTAIGPKSPGRNGSVAAAGIDIGISRVPFDQPWTWLGAGWRDLWQQPAISLAYGLGICGAGLLLGLGMLALGLEAVLPVLAGGFMLVGPVLALGLYDKSIRIASGRPLSLGATLRAAAGSMGRVSLLATCLLLIYLIWIRIAFLLLMLFLGTGGLPPAREFMPTLLFTPYGLGLLVTGTIVGALLAAFVFAITVVSIPLLLEQRVDAFTAMAVSVRAVIANPKPMALWAALIAGYVALGVATLGAGLVVAFPLLGHATWHAYRDVIRR